MMRLFLLFGFCALVLLASQEASARDRGFPSQFDRDIERAVKRWWPDLPLWRLLKAQLYQESRLNPAAISPVGARGLGQFMPGTWLDMARELRLPQDASPHDRVAIDAAAYYMAKLRLAWAEPRPIEDRHSLALASYNAGLGNVLAAQRRCAGARSYRAIISCLPMTTGRHSRETIGYVRSIWRWFNLMETQS